MENKVSSLREPYLKEVLLTYGGTETSLIFEKKVNLPDFCAWTAPEDAIKQVHGEFLGITQGLGLIMDAPTWRASPDYINKLGGGDINEIVRKCVDLQRTLLHESMMKPEYALLSAEIGPRGDGYHVENRMTYSQAAKYHLPQISALVNAKVQLATALTLNYADEAIGIAIAAQDCGLPIIIGCTLETNGLLPDGSTLEHFVCTIDRATSESPLCYIINCCHPTHCYRTLEIYSQTPWFSRLRGIRANASEKSHDELDHLDHLEPGDPIDFAQRLFDLHSTYPNFRILGGCCGSNHLHLKALADRFRHAAA